MFHAVVEQIKHLIRDQISRAKGKSRQPQVSIQRDATTNCFVRFRFVARMLSMAIQRLFLVGGFAESSYLRDQVKDLCNTQSPALRFFSPTQRCVFLSALGLQTFTAE